MTSTLENQAVRGRRIEIALYRDKDTYLPGIITRVSLDRSYFWVRLDGKRSNLPVRTDHEYLRYLDQVVDVPDLPMGVFTPVADDMNGFYEHAGVLVAAIGEDGEDLVVLTEDLDKAVEAAIVYGPEAGFDPDYFDREDMQARWVVFEWMPEDAEFPWLMNCASKGDDHAVHVYYLPTA